MNILERINECYESAKELIMNSQSALNTDGIKRQVISDDLVKVFEQVRELHSEAIKAAEQNLYYTDVLAELNQLKASKDNEIAKPKVSVIINIDTLVRGVFQSLDGNLKDIETEIKSRVEEAVLVALKANELQSVKS